MDLSPVGGEGATVKQAGKQGVMVFYMACL
jgi:hypothetical protein